MNSKKHLLFIGLLVFCLSVFSLALEISKHIGSSGLGSKNSADLFSNIISMVRESIPMKFLDEKIERKETPQIVRGVYLTSWSASLKSRLDYVVNLAKTSGVNSVVVDIKDYTGYVNYDSKVPAVVEINAKKKRISDIGLLIKNFHENGIYVIARIAVFQDPVLVRAKNNLAVYDKAKSIINLTGSDLPNTIVPWTDNKGLGWTDPASEEAQNYNISIAKEAWELGFDEINFDYVRFPSDGSLANMGFPFWDGKTQKHFVIKNFFKRMREELPEAKLSVDLFGLATINNDDLGIGQVIEDAFDYFDYVCPMVYPSHYASGFRGYVNPANYPYEVIKYSMETAKIKLDNYKKSVGAESVGIKAKLRPWVQDFNMGATYDSVMVLKEINGAKDGLKEEYAGFLVWSPSNVYNDSAIKADAFAPVEKEKIIPATETEPSVLPVN